DGKRLRSRDVLAAVRGPAAVLQPDRDGGGAVGAGSGREGEGPVGRHRRRHREQGGVEARHQEGQRLSGLVEGTGGDVRGPTTDRDGPCVGTNRLVSPRGKTRRVVDGSNGDRDGAGGAAAVAVTDLVGDGVAAVEVLVGPVDQEIIAEVGGRAVVV